MGCTPADDAAGELDADAREDRQHVERRAMLATLASPGCGSASCARCGGARRPGLALRIYRQAMRSGEDKKAALRAVVEGAPSDAADVPIPSPAQASS